MNVYFSLTPSPSVLGFKAKGSTQHILFCTWEVSYRELPLSILSGCIVRMYHSVFSKSFNDRHVSYFWSFSPMNSYFSYEMDRSFTHIISQLCAWNVGKIPRSRTVGSKVEETPTLPSLFLLQMTLTMPTSHFLESPTNPYSAW